jgi:hypothetical protein
LDVSRSLKWVALGAILLLGLILRLRGLHDPILDHPGWRQGDTAAIARNFATLDFNPLHPQADYDGPPPNYVELELQIVPLLAATLYKVFGVHEVFGRLISIAFSLGTVAVLFFFARDVIRLTRSAPSADANAALTAKPAPLDASEIAGLVAAFAFAVFPGSLYYGRTFMPDTTMTFFLTAALYACARWLLAPRGTLAAFAERGLWPAAILTALAILAKPVALVALVPIAALMLQRDGILGTLRRPETYAFFTLALAPYFAYDRAVSSIAEWHWASGITQKHVLPDLRAAFASFGAFKHKLGLFVGTFGLLRATMLGPLAFWLALVAILVPAPRRARPLLFAWLGGVLLYAYAVVTVERVDYYLYVALPLAALWIGFASARLAEFVPPTRPARVGAALAAAALALGLIVIDRRSVSSYYAYPKAAYRTAKTLDATLDADALVVMGHYDPSILYYIGRKGWEEDPKLWTPFDEQSAIKKGARYFIAIEANRLKKNAELAAWLERFPVRNAAAKWPVYETDPSKILPGAEERWKAFRKREKSQHKSDPPHTS